MQDQPKFAEVTAVLKKEDERRKKAKKKSCFWKSAG